MSDILINECFINKSIYFQHFYYFFLLLIVINLYLRLEILILFFFHVTNHYVCILM